MNVLRTWHNRGLSIIPLLPHKKCPAISSWKLYQERQATEAEICDWETRWPEANVGILTGAINSLLVVDLDGVPALSSIRQMPEIRSGWAVKTPRGNHHYLRLSTGQQYSNRVAILPGVDIRANGGYVVGPGSIVAGSRYVDYTTWPGTQSLPTVPDSLQCLLHQTQPVIPPPTRDKITAPNRYSAIALERECSKVAHAPKGARNHTLNRSAYKIGRYIQLGTINPQLVEEELLRAATIAGIPNAEAKRTIASGIRAGRER